MANEDEGTTPATPEPTDPASELKRFLDAFTALPASIEQGMLDQADNEDEKAFTLAFSTPLKEQVAQLSEFVEVSSRGISRKATADVADVLRISAANTLVRQAHGIAENLSAESARIGICALFEMIKKVIRALLEIFGISLPKWLDKLLELIDEIICWLASGGNLKSHGDLSRVHQDYLADLTQLARLERESQWKYAHVTDEE